jgi:hypothetical protein
MIELTFHTVVAHVSGSLADRLVYAERLDGTAEGRLGEEGTVLFLPLPVQLGMSMREDACRCVNAVHLDCAARCKL